MKITRDGFLYPDYNTIYAFFGYEIRMRDITTERESQNPAERAKWRRKITELESDSFDLFKSFQ